ncbi:unnamed protein product, partial [Rotaria magnacalcarata]
MSEFLYLSFDEIVDLTFRFDKPVYKVISNVNKCGNVYCGSLLKEHINEIIMNKQSNRYFLMSRIYPPIYSSLIRSSRPNDNNEFISEKQISGELGVFGSLISR